MGVADTVYVGHLCLGLDAVHAGHGGDGESSSFVRPAEGGLAGGQLEAFVNFGVRNIFYLLTMLGATLHRCLI